MNVWLALAYDLHVHHEVVRDWFDGLGAGDAVFCRMTQIGFLRLLTNARVMGRDVLSQKGAWRIFDQTLRDARVAFLSEPAGVEAAFRRLTQGAVSAPNLWPDAYLAAVASTAGLGLATLDRALAALPGVDVFCLLPG